MLEIMNNIGLHKYVAQNNGKEKTETLWRKISNFFKSAVNTVVTSTLGL